MSKYYKITMFVEVDENHIDNDAIVDLHIRDLLENSEAIHNCDIDNSREVDELETPFWLGE